MSSLSSSSNSGSVKMWKYVFIVLIYVVTLEVTPVISPRASPIFNSQIILDTFPDFHTFRVIRLKQPRHISRFPGFHTSRVIG